LDSTNQNTFFRDLYKAYGDYLDSKAAILNIDLEFYESIAYTIIRGSNQGNIRLKLHVGDVVELKEESEGIAYARIKSIF
jgi:hypothetical protein